MALDGSEDFLKADEYLIPVLENDALLRACSLSASAVHLTPSPEIQPDDCEWSDEDGADVTSKKPSNLQEANRAIHALQQKLQKAQQDLVDYRSFVSERLNLTSLGEALKETASTSSSSTHIAAPLRDDDSHYFQSYGENGA